MILTNVKITPYLAPIKKYAKEYKIPEEIIASVILQESNGNAKAWNGSGGENSRGLMQLSRKAILAYGLTDSPMILDSLLYNPEINIKYGARHLRDKFNELKSSFDENLSLSDKWKMAVSAYNQGAKFWRYALASNFGSQSWVKVLNSLNSNPRTPSITKKHSLFYASNVFSRVNEKSLKPNTSFIIPLIGIMTLSLVVSFYFYRGQNAK